MRVNLLSTSLTKPIIICIIASLMKILITGIEGYLGSVLYHILQLRGYSVQGIDTGYYRDGLFFDLPSPQQVLYSDIRHVTSARLQGYDVVIHLADLSNDPLGMIDEEVTRSINFYGATEFAKKAKKAGVRRYIYSSSCSVYGISSEKEATEESETHPQTMYAQCKLDSEKEIAHLADSTFTPVYLRNATIYGLSPRMRFDLVVNKLAADAYVNKKIYLDNGGRQWRPLVHILDACEAFVCALEAPAEKVYNQVFNVGARNGNYSIAEIGRIIQAEFTESKIHVGEQNGDTRNYQVSFEKIHTQLPGYKSKYHVADGVKELHRKFDELQMTKEMYNNPSFVRVNKMQDLLVKKSLDTNFNWNIAFSLPL